MSALGTGSMSALGTLVERHQQRLRALAYRITSRWDVADDIAQEAFLRLYRASARYQPTAALSTWLYRIVVNLCLDHARRPRPAREDGTEPATSQSSGPDALIRDETIEAVRHEIRLLPERQRVAVVLHRFDGLTYREISDVTGWSESAVESLLVRAYGQLRERLKGRVEA